ncbi:AT-hook motif nuclear-localized protein 10 isoform X2 [Mangifera indica]|nr:AT-hook motif nuclear-localized protein 10 isoform X2 [Mangifera indica]XP_044511031.1 AT-hook motif nuclear-localized protein 10 isoform X2 [Mangifera indica]
MSGSESGVNVMTSREAFNTGLQKSVVQPQPVIHNMRLAFSSDGTAVYKPVTPPSPTYQPTNTTNPADGGPTGLTSPQGVNMNMGGSEPMKRKRGRPRKYGPDGTMSLALVPSPTSASANQSGGGGFSPQGGSASPNSLKKARGRPPGSSKKHQLEALGSAGVGFTPHVITVKAGEDVSSKIMSFSQHGPRAVCILSANGAISNVTLRQPATSGGTVTYEGRFEILSLSGSFLLSENGGQRSRTGGLSVSLSGPDGRVLGGGVAGLLTAASPVQVVVGSFIAEGRKESKSSNHMEPSSAPSKIIPGGGSAGASSPPSRGTLSESSGGPGSPLNQSTGACNNNHPQGMPPSMPWK